MSRPDSPATVLLDRVCREFYSRHPVPLDLRIALEHDALAAAWDACDRPWALLELWWQLDRAGVVAALGARACGVVWRLRRPDRAPARAWLAELAAAPPDAVAPRGRRAVRRYSDGWTDRFRAAVQACRDHAPPPRELAYRAIGYLAPGAGVADGGWRSAHDLGHARDALDVLDLYAAVGRPVRVPRAARRTWAAGLSGWQTRRCDGLRAVAPRPPGADVLALLDAAAARRGASRRA